MTNYSTKISDNSKDIFNESVLSPLFGEVVGGKLTSQPDTRHYTNAINNSNGTSLITSTTGGERYKFPIPANTYIKPSHIRVMYHVENKNGNTYGEEADADAKTEFGNIQIRNCNSSVFNKVVLQYDGDDDEVTIERPYLQELIYNMKQPGSPDDELSTSFVKHENTVPANNNLIDKDNKFIRNIDGTTEYKPRKYGFSSFKERETLCQQVDKSDNNLGVINVPLDWLFNGNQFFSKGVTFSVYQNNSKNIFSFAEHPADAVYTTNEINSYEFKIHFMELIYDEIHLTEEYKTKIKAYRDKGNSIVNLVNTVSFKNKLDFQNDITDNHEYKLNRIKLPSAVLFGFMPVDNADTIHNFNSDNSFYGASADGAGVKHNRRKLSEQRTTLPYDKFNLKNYHIKYTGDDNVETNIPNNPITLKQHPDKTYETFDVYKRFIRYFGDKCPIDYEDWKTNYNFYIVDLTDSVGEQHIDPNLKSGDLTLCFDLQAGITPPPGYELVVLPIYNNIFTQEGTAGEYKINKRV